MKRKLFTIALLCLVGLLPLSAFSQIKLAEWSFDNVYATSIVGSTTNYLPTTTVFTVNPALNIGGDYAILPDTIFADSTNFKLTSPVANGQIREGYSNYVLMLMFQGPSQFSDYTNGATHKNYYQFSFSTKGYDDITLDFSFSSGQNNPEDFLEVVYSTDGGTSWVDASKYNAATGWWIYNASTVSISAKHKEQVLVRLLCNSTVESSNVNFNLDYFKVSGSKSFEGLVVDTNATITWPLDLGNEGQIATYSGETTNYFKADHITVGSTISYFDNNTTLGVTYTRFQPSAQLSAADLEGVIGFNIWPKTGLSFTPKSFAFDCMRFGTDGGKLDVVWKTSDGTRITLATGITPKRNNDTSGTHVTYDISGVTIPASTAECTLELYLYALGNTKQVGIANVTLTGSITGTISDIVSYKVKATVSPADAGSITSLPVGNEFDNGTEVTLTTSRNFGYVFQKWEDDSNNTLSTENPYTFTLDADKIIVAKYTTLVTYNLSLQVLGSQWGEIALSPEPTDGKYEAGTIVTAKVVENQVTTFNYWDDSSSAAEKTIVMDEDRSVSATFDEIPFILGWNFMIPDPKTARPGDFYSETTNTGTLSVHKSDGSTVGWLANVGAFSPRSSNARIWAADFVNDRRYFMASFSTQNYTNIEVKSMMGASYQAYSVQKVEYSTDGTLFKPLTTVDLTAGYNATWVEANAKLPLEAENQTKVYIRWIADTTSPLLGSGNDGTALTNVFVYADKVVVNDTVSPLLLSTVPTKGAANASANGSITLTFNEKVTAGTGNCTLGDVVIDPVFGAKTATFKYNKLDYNTDYTFTVPAGAIQDKSGNAFGDTTITFRTMERPQPIAKVFDAVVAIDNSGDYTSLQAAIDAAPSQRAMPWLIFIKNGKYEGHVDIPESKPFIHLIGQSVDGVIVSDDRLCGAGGIDPNATVYHVSLGATVVVNSSDCYFENITFQNAYGYERQSGPQALAMYTNNDRITFKNCTLRSYQDTYLTSTKSATDRHYLVNCRIEGAVDYIYGAGDVFFDECVIYNVRPSGGYIVAPNHPAGTLWGYVFNHCIIDGNPGVITYYGRPWHNSPKTIFLNSVLKCSIYAGGWYYKMGAIPAIFADYGTADENGNLVDLSNRISEYEYDTRDASGNLTGVVKGTAKNRLTDEEASTYTYENVMLRDGSTWEPKVLTEATEAPQNLELENNTLTWDNTSYAMCYVVTRNGSVIGFTTETSFTDSTAVTDEHYTYSVEAASGFGALSMKSTEVKNFSTAVVERAKDAEITVVNDGGVTTISGLSVSSVVSIYNLAGQLISETTSKNSLESYNLCSGIYILKVRSNEKTSSFKVVCR